MKRHRKKKLSPKVDAKCACTLAAYLVDDVQVIIHHHPQRLGQVEAQRHVGRERVHVRAQHRSPKQRRLHCIFEAALIGQFLG